MDQQSAPRARGAPKHEGKKMRVPAAILLATLVATPAFAIDVVSGSGAVVKNGAGLNVVNGDPCDGRLEAACLSREEDRRPGRTEFAPAVEQTEEPDPEYEPPTDIETVNRVY